MHNTIRITVRRYIISTVWLAVMLGTTSVASQAMAPLLTWLDLDPLGRTVTTMAVAILVATVAAGIVARLPRVSGLSVRSRLGSSRVVRSRSHA